VRTGDLILLGDSITEHWPGTDLSVPEQQYDFFPRLYEELQEEYYMNGIALGIAGDRTNQLLYRVQHGELSFVKDQTNPKVIWLLIGTNDLGDGCSIEYIIVGIINIIQSIRKQIIAEAAPRKDPRTNTNKVYIVVNSILPRPIDPTGLLRNENIKKQSPWNDILLINKYLQCYVFSEQQQQQQQKDQSGDTVVIDFFNATSIFLENEYTTTNGEDGPRIRKEYMNDGLHPTYEGSEVWGRAILEKATELINQP